MKYTKLFSLAIVLTLSLSQDSVENYYNTNCKACHTIGGGKLIGPDLLGVHNRADRDWLINWIVDPAGVLASGDAYAQQILKEANNVPMIKSPGINAELAEDLLDYIQSKIDSGDIDAAYVEPVFTDEDLEKGGHLFMGRTQLTEGGAPCVSCHTVNSIGGLGGGKLGVNLTDAYNRLGLSRGLTTWLKAPPTETMKPVFEDHPLSENEILELTAFLKHEFEQSGTQLFAASANLFLYGFLGVILMFVLIGMIWSNRFKAVRKPLVKGNPQP